MQFLINDSSVSSISDAIEISGEEGFIVLTFQVPDLRVEIFFVLLLGAQFTIRFSVFVPSPTHLVGLANRGGTALY